MRPAHYWRKAGPAAAPSNILVFDTETWHGDKAKVNGGELHTLRLGCALGYRLERERRTRTATCRFTRAEQFWQFVHDRLSGHRPLWIFAHNLPYDFGIVDGWQWLLGDSWETKRAAISSTIFYVDGMLDGKRIILCDTINYYKCSLATIGKAMGIDKLDMPTQSATDDDWYTYCERDVEVTARGVDGLIQFVRTHRLGPWQPTVAGLSFSAYKSRFLHPKVLVHDNESVLELERQAYYGGCVDTPRIGVVVKGPIYEMDVCSMYPYCCTLDLPYQLVGTDSSPNHNRLRDYLERYMVIANVRINTSSDTYPMRIKGRTFHPQGVYETTLAHPELKLAYERGHIDVVLSCAVYNKAPIFKTYMDTFGRLKAQYDRCGNEAFRTLCKYYMNALYGKTGQMTPSWQEWGRESLQAIESRYGLRMGSLCYLYGKPPDLYQPEEEYIIPELPEPLSVRDLYGIVEVKVDEYESRDSCPAIAATVTSYARTLLRHFQAVAGHGQWFYSDTDSVWTNTTGRERLQSAGTVAENVLGKLGCKEPHKLLRVWGPKDYETDRIVRMKGVRPKATPTIDGGWCQLQFPSALTQLKDRRRGAVFVKHITKHLRRTVDRVRLLRDGWTRPLVFPREMPCDV